MLANYIWTQSPILESSSRRDQQGLWSEDSGEELPKRLAKNQKKRPAELIPVKRVLMRSNTSLPCLGRLKISSEGSLPFLSPSSSNPCPLCLIVVGGYYD